MTEGIKFLSSYDALTEHLGFQLAKPVERSSTQLRCVRCGTNTDLMQAFLGFELASPACTDCLNTSFFRLLKLCHEVNDSLRKGYDR